MLNAVSSSGSKKQVILRSNDVGDSQVLYTVPEGKTLIGTFSGNSSGYFYINSTIVPANIIPIYPHNTYGNTMPSPVTMLAGTVIKGGAAGAWFIGVEQ